MRTAISRTLRRMPAKQRSSSAKAQRGSDRATARLEARIPSDLKALLEEAAPLAGHSSMTDYLVQSLRRSAEQTIADSRRSRLEAGEAASFVRALLSPAAPNRALREAFTRHRAQVG